METSTTEIKSLKDIKVTPEKTPYDTDEEKPLKKGETAELAVKNVSQRKEEDEKIEINVIKKEEANKTSKKKKEKK